MALSAIIFDMDGTLIDSNAMHVRAWDEALRKHQYRVSADRIAVEIGKGGDRLIPDVLGGRVEREDGDSLRKAHAAEFKRLADSTPLRVFPGAEDLLDAIRRRGLRLALATSSEKKDLHTTWRSAGFDWSDRFDVIATAEDAAESKPAPAIVQAAIDRLGLSPAQCAMVGDTPYDADSARDAGAVCLGFTCGGMNDREKLRGAGMRAVFRDPAEMTDRLDEALRTASPGSAILTRELVESLMRQALDVARAGMHRGEVPIGCVIARGDGAILARGHNELNASGDRTAHAEMVAFRRTAGLVPTDARDLILVSTLEPCVMCLGASMEAAVDTILFGLKAPADGGRGRVRPPVSPESQMPRILGDVLAEESRRLLREFLNRPPGNPMQAEFVRDLLART